MSATTSTDWFTILYNISPYYWGYLGVGFSLGLSILGAAWGIFLTGSSLMAASVKCPRITSKNLVSVIFCEAVAIYGVIMGIIMVGKFENLALDTVTKYEHALWCGYSLFAIGIYVGLSNLFCG